MATSGSPRAGQQDRADTGGLAEDTSTEFSGLTLSNTPKVSRLGRTTSCGSPRTVAMATVRSVRIDPLAVDPAASITELIATGLTPAESPRGDHRWLGRQPLVHGGQRKPAGAHHASWHEHDHRVPLAEGSNPEGIASGPDGNLWFVELPRAARLASVVSIREPPIRWRRSPSSRPGSPTPAADGIAAGCDGNLVHRRRRRPDRAHHTDRDDHRVPKQESRPAIRLGSAGDAGGQACGSGQLFTDGSVESVASVWAPIAPPTTTTTTQRQRRRQPRRRPQRPRWPPLSSPHRSSPN